MTTRQFNMEQAANRRVPDNWREWPDEYRCTCEWAVRRELERTGGRIVADESRCTEQAESIYQNAPYLQEYRFLLTRSVTIEVA